MEPLERNDVPLFAFATAMEFSKVFPEDFPRDCPLKTLIPLSGKFYGAYACILGVGILDFTAGLFGLLFKCKQTNVEISSVINVGICGAYPNRGLSVLDVVNIANDRVGDLGCEERDGSFSLWSKVYAASSLESMSLRIRRQILSLPQVKGVTVSCCTGTGKTAINRVKLLDSDVESMEGAACFSVCESLGIPAFQIRAVSNIASTRDKSSWKIGDALEKIRIVVNS